MHINARIWVYLAVHLADESAVGAINRPLHSLPVSFVNLHNQPIQP